MSVSPAGDAPGSGRSAGEATATGGRLLRRYRSLAGLTQEQLAELSGYSANYIGKLERDEREPPAAALDRLATTLGLGNQKRAALEAARQRRGGPDSPRPLAGRDREVAELRRHLAAVGPPVLLLAGEPGMGKTRLLEEAASLAVQGGWAVAHGGCQRRAQDLYAPLTGALTDALRRLPEADRASVFRRAGRLDLLLPELASAGPQEPGSGGWHGGAGEPPAREQEQRRLVVSAAERCLRAVSGAAGTLLILDDLQWAGPDAFDLVTALATAAGSPAIRLIGAYRDSETAGTRLADFMADLARASLVRVLELDRLSDAESEQLVTGAMSGGRDLPAVLPAIVRRAGGVPFFLVSYVEEVRERGTDQQRLELPWTVAQVIRQRVVALPDLARDLLAVAAAVGRMIPHRLLVQVTGRTDDEVIEAVEAALDARLLAEDGPAGYRFTHDLIRETIENELSAPRRRLLHRRIAETLERDPRTPAESLAFHFALGDDDGKAVTYLELAGDQAQQRVAYGAAADFFQQVIGRLELAGRPTDAVPVGEKLGMALYRAGRYGEAIAPLESALDGYRAAGDEEGVQRVTGRLADAHFRLGTSQDALGHLATLAESGAVNAASAGSQGAMTRWQGLVRLLYAHGSYQRIVTIGRSLTRVGRATGNTKLQTTGRRVEGAGIIALGRLPAGAALLEATMPQEPVPGRDERAVEVAALLSAAYLSMGSPERSQALSARMLGQAEAVKDDVIAAMHALLLGAAHYVQGDWALGHDLVHTAQERLTAAGPSPLVLRMVPVVASCLVWEGAWEQARRYLNNALRTARATRLVFTERAALTYLAELDLLEGRPQAALARLQPLLGGDLTWDYAISLQSTAAAAQLELGDQDQARQHAGRAVAEARRTGAWVFGVRALLVQGMVESGRGDHDLAHAAYEEGLRRARDMPFPYGEAALLQACGLLDRQQGNEAAARAKLSQALAIAEDLRAGSSRPATSRAAGTISRSPLCPTR